MRQAFLRMLLLCIAGAFVLTLAFSFWLQTNEARENAVEVIGLKLQDLAGQIRQTSENLRAVRAFADEMLLLKARRLRTELQEHPECIRSQEALDRLCRRLQVDEAHLSDAKGILIASHPARYKGYDMASAPQSAAFLPCLTDPDFTLVQPPQPNGIAGILQQYAGVARLDEPGIIQIGMSAEWQRDLIRTADFSNLGGGLRIGQHGMVLLCRDGVVVSSPDRRDVGRSIQWFGLTPEDLRNSLPHPVTDIQRVKRLAVVSHIQDIHLVGLLPFSEMYFSRDDLLNILVCCNFVVFGIVFVLISELVQRIVIRGIERVNRSLERIAAGDLHERVDERSNPEFVMLSDGINSTVDALKAAYDKEAAHLRMELRFAQDIQRSALPDCQDPFPQFPGIQIHADMQPAKVVGGDFYDFFPVGEHALAFVVADVSDKGVPAALFMMTAKTLLKNLCIQGGDLAEIAGEANRRLCENNATQMFVTALIGRLEVATGRLTLVNAGHCQPLLKRRDGGFGFLKVRPDLVLAGMPGVRYHSTEMRLLPGDRLFLYTDGVTEALDSRKELFGGERLLALLNGCRRGGAPRGLVECVRSGLKLFCGDAEQADDVTMLALSYAGCNRIRVRAVRERLPEVQDFVEGYLGDFGVGPKAMVALKVAVEEVFVNIASYAYGEGQGDAWIRCDVDPEAREVTIVFRDGGVRYDPLARPDPDVTLPLEKRTVGGLGIFMVKKSMDAVEYRYENSQNVLTLHRRY